MFRSLVVALGVNIISIPAFGGIVCVNAVDINKAIKNNKFLF
jgi:hypothetical protein